MFCTAPDIPYLARKRVDSDQVGEGTYFPLALTRQEMAEFLWRPKTVRVTWYCAFDWRVLGDHGQHISGNVNVDSVCHWGHWVVQPVHNYTWQRDQYGAPPETGDPMVDAETPQDMLTWWSWRVPQKNEAQPFEDIDGVPIQVRHVVRGAQGGGHMDWVSIPDTSEPDEIFTVLIESDSLIQMQILGKGWFDGHYHVISTNPGETIDIERDEAVMFSSVQESSMEYLLFDGDTFDSATVFYPQIQITVVDRSSYLHDVETGFVIVSSLNYDPARQKVGDFELLGHKVPMFTPASTETIINSVTGFGACVIEEEHEL